MTSVEIEVTIDHFGNNVMNRTLIIQLRNCNLKDADVKLHSAGKYQYWFE